jgi:hypothetical protein
VTPPPPPHPPRAPQGRIEYTTIVRHYFGPRAYVVAQIGLNGALQSLNIISVIQSAQARPGAAVPQQLAHTPPTFCRRNIDTGNVPCMQTWRLSRCHAVR